MSDEQSAGTASPQGTESTAPEATDSKGTEQASSGGDWREALPAEFRDAPFFKGDGRTPEQVRADLENAASWQGNSIRIPGPDATEQARQEFIRKAIEKLPGMMPVPDYDNQDEVLAKLGKPEEPSKYKLPEELDDNTKMTLRQRAFDAGLTQKQLDKLVAAELSNTSLAQEAREAAQKAAREELKTDWGAAMEDRLRDVESLLEAEGAPELLKERFKAGDLDAATTKWLYGIVESGAERAEVAEQESGRTGKLTPLEARSQAQEIWEQLYTMKATDPRYNDLKAKRRELIEMYTS